jgi:hypothetical protein
MKTDTHVYPAMYLDMLDRFGGSPPTNNVGRNS